MQLNNTITGEIIKLNLFDIRQNRIVYTLYKAITQDSSNNIINLGEEMKVLKPNGFDLSQAVDASLTLQENLDKFAYLEIINDLGNDWVLSNDTQNWMFSEVDRIIRITVDNTKNSNELVNNPTYKALMDAIIVKHSGFIISNDKYSFIYVLTLDSTETTIIQSFIDDWIFIENKVI